MTLLFENETSEILSEEINALIRKAIETSADVLECPYEFEVSVTITDNKGIQEINLEHRGKNQPTDVLSFPMLEFEEHGDFGFITDDEDDLFNLDTGELMIGDIILSFERAKEQAIEYGHSLEREIGFLVIHSMLHLFGFDHMTPEDEPIMLEKQKLILNEMLLSR